MHSVKLYKNKPLFQIRVDSQKSKYRVGINGAIVFEWNRISPIAASFPVNQWLKNGDNKLTLEISASSLASGECQAELLCLDLEDEEYVQKKITDLTLVDAQDRSLPADSDGDVLVSETEQITLEDENSILWRGVRLPVKFPTWRWLTSDVIVDNDETMKELFIQYQKIWHLLQNKETTKIYDHMSERLEEYAIAFYETTQAMADRTKISKMVGDSDRDLSPLDERAQLEISGEGRLARLLRQDGNDMISFAKKDNSSTAYYDFIFRRQAGQWVLCR